MTPSLLEPAVDAGERDVAPDPRAARVEPLGKIRLLVDDVAGRSG